MRPVLKILEQMKLKPKELLKPDPLLEFYADIHRYYDLRDETWVPAHISSIAKDNSYFKTIMERPDENKDKQKLVEATERGTAVHACVENFFTTGQPGNAGKWQPWLDQFLQYPNLKGWDCVACEYRMIDRRFGIAGTLDFLLEKDERLVLCDLKTKSPGFRKNHMDVKTQLGGYVSLLYHNWPTLNIDQCRVYWVTNEKCETDNYDVITCLDLYESARRNYRQTQLPI